MKKNYVVGFLSMTPLIWSGISMLFPAIGQNTLIWLLIGSTSLCFFAINLYGKDALDIGAFSAFLVFLIGADRAYDFIKYDYGTLNSLAEAASMLLCSVGFFHYMLSYGEQKEEIKNLQRLQKRCEVLENTVDAYRKRLDEYENK